MLERHSGDEDNPRILGAFNEETPDWLSFFMFTYFTDRDGKFQLASLRESAFDPLSRTCDFMIKEEAHHMFVGATGVGRVVQRTAELMRQHDTDDVHPHGGFNLEVLQRYINFHYSVSLDLFGSETSTNAANYFAAGLKGRFQEEKRDDDHLLKSSTRLVPDCNDTGIGSREATQLAALNETLRDDYREDCQNGLDRWNRTLSEHGIDARLQLPHIGFHRNVGTFRGRHVTPDGQVLGPKEWAANKDRWLPNDQDKAHVQSLMHRVDQPGQMAGWVAPPSRGIHQKPLSYEYVRI
jgi:benzoyl-CoA 2,3-dioxygenase component B